MGRPSQTPYTLRATLDEYDDEHDQAELNRFRNMTSLREAIRKAALSKTEEGEPYPHQRKNWNFWPDSIPKAESALVAAEGEFRRCGDFAAIHDLVTSRLGKLEAPGLGELYCYDVAFRIGAKLGHLPERVYLHAGTREGAERLLGRSLKRTATVELDELPELLRGRAPWEVENILCSYAKRCRAMA